MKEWGVSEKEVILGYTSYTIFTVEQIDKKLGDRKEIEE